MPKKRNFSTQAWDFGNKKGKFSNDLNPEINLISKISFQKWYCLITLKIEDFKFTLKALVDSGTYQNCIQECLIPIKYSEKTT